MAWFGREDMVFIKRIFRQKGLEEREREKQWIAGKVVSGGGKLENNGREKGREGEQAKVSEGESSRVAAQKQDFPER